MNAIRIGNAPCSWGALEFADAKSGRLGYTRMLDELVESGYSGSELGDWGFMPTEPERLADEFRSRAIDLTGAFVGVALRNPAAHAPGLQQVLKVAALVSRTTAQLAQNAEAFLVLADDNGTDPVRTGNAGRITPAQGLTAGEWRTFASGAEQIARAVRDETGLRTVFHHHCAGFVETPDEIEQLLDATDGSVLGLVFDTGHYAFGAGGCDSVLAALNRFAARIGYVHFKDCHAQVMQRAKEHGWDYFQSVRNGVFSELGQGCVDFPTVHDWLTQHGYTGYITVEQDVLPGMGTPRESALRNREYLRSIGL